ncbi:hypothetical protein SBI_02430 [Streptomyces bingchenggensis BCW-1]|uniref:Uncharacterized protein n=1 Tax=Streptomyces bingchenggensis (strain BCW-1) TaxID=749414 RepID=D7BX06_STRBB|nr:hypothetical protein SBI_02430 [Streptomyces bingchenggensis BCW-1]
MTLCLTLTLTLMLTLTLPLTLPLTLTLTLTLVRERRGERGESVTGCSWAGSAVSGAEPG